MRVTQPLKRNLQQIPEDIATVCGDRSHTWSQLVHRISALAGGLVDLGLKPQERVAIVALNSDLYLETIFAAPWAGGVIVPINYRWSAPEIAFALNDSGTKIIFVDETFSDVVPDLKKLVEHELTVVSLDDAFEGCDEIYEDLVSKSTELPEFENLSLIHI